MEEDLTVDLYLIYSLMSLFLVCFAGCMSGLTIGLLSIGDLELEMKLISGTPTESEQARRIIPIVADHHLVLVTLLLANAVAMEALPLFLDEMVPSWIAVVISTSFVLIFGEVLPQAVLTGPNQLKLASSLIPIVKCVKFVFFPIAWPVARILDRVLGHKVPTRYSDNDLKTLISLHVKNELKLHLKETAHGLNEMQAKIIYGAIELRNETVKDCMTELYRVRYISEDIVLDRETMAQLLHEGYSRLPVFRGKPSKIIGILQVKKLITVNPDSCLTLRASGIPLRKPIKVSADQKLLSTLMMFCEGKGHLAMVRDVGKHTIGIITLEDVIERLVRKDILDEDDLDHLSTAITSKAYHQINRRNTVLNQLPSFQDLKQSAMSFRASNDDYFRLYDN